MKPHLKMTKYFKMVVTIAIMYALPLLAKPELILNYKILLLMAVAAILFLTQPEMSFKEAKEKQKTDRNSIFMILGAAVISQVTAVIEWGYFRQNPNHFGFLTIFGFLLLAGGAVFRIWSIKTLGRFFTATVQIKEGHQIVKTGPYALVRHPSYLGSYAAMLGSAIFLEAFIGTLVTVVFMFFAYKIRIEAEETALTESLGESYRDYQKTTKKMIPLLW